MSITENVCVGALATGPLGFVDWKARGRAARDLLLSLGVDRQASEAVGALTQSERAIVAIARALYARGRFGARLLVLDEPTANLTGVECKRLFAAMRSAADSGTAVVFCTHRLDEVLAVADSVAVLRDGRLVAHQPIAESGDERQIAKQILGREVEAFFAVADRERSLGAPALSVRSLAGGEVKDLTFEVRGGEVVGITGLIGDGQDSVPSLLIAATKRTAGAVSLGDRVLRHLAPAVAVAAGLVMLPADRKRNSGLMSASIRENITLASLRHFTTLGVIRSRRERKAALRLMKQFDVRPAGDCDRLLSQLSGGNQQKVLLAKWIAAPKVRVVVLHEPTQGVDVGAKQAILADIASLAERDVGVIVVSSEHQELSHICDRVLVMRSGAIRADLHRPTADQISHRCLLA